MEKREIVICEDGNIYALAADGRWERKEKYVGTIATYDKLPFKVVGPISEDTLHKFVYEGKHPTKDL